MSRFDWEGRSVDENSSATAVGSSAASDLLLQLHLVGECETCERIIARGTYVIFHNTDMELVLKVA